MLTSPSLQELGSELWISLRVSKEPSDDLCLACVGSTGTTLAGLEVPAPDQELLSDFALRVSERLEALLAHVGDQTQQVRLAYPDGSAIEDLSSLTVAELLSSERWRLAEANASRPASNCSSPSKGAIPESPSAKRRAASHGKSGARDLEVRLGKLQDVKSGSSKRGLTSALSSSMGSDWASPSIGGKVLMATSLDDKHPPANVIDGREFTYWISTGLYPQEILLQLGHPAKVSDVWLSTTNVRSVCIEGCMEETAVSFETLAAAEIAAGDSGRLQLQQLHCQEQIRPTRFVKAKILSGWDDFCTVHRIVVH